MSTNNQNIISQLLIRNINLLSAKHPLFINLMADNFINEYQQKYPNALISAYNSNYQTYHQHQAQNICQASFSAYYQEKKQHDLVIIAYPKSKAELPFILAMLNKCLTENANVVIVGEKNSGINSSQKSVASYLDHYQKYDSARHCMLFTGQYKHSNTTFKLEQWFSNYQININNISLEIAALPGVFSQKKLDIGTEVLLNNLPELSPGSALDFGCGAGVIASYISKRQSNVSIELCDVSALALASAEQTLKLNGLSGKIFASDSLSDINNHYQNVITNPPFHQGIKTNYTATESFLSGIGQFCLKQGQLWVVANNFLSYEPIIEKSFAKVRRVTNQQGFIIYQAIK